MTTELSLWEQVADILRPVLGPKKWQQWFDKGAVVQTGSHDELLADENGKYSELWYAQAQYYNN